MADRYWRCKFEFYDFIQKNLVESKNPAHNLKKSSHKYFPTSKNFQEIPLSFPSNYLSSLTQRKPLIAPHFHSINMKEI